MITPAKSPHILLVDETPEIRTLLAGALSSAGFRVTTASSIQDLDTVQRHAPDLIVHEFVFDRDVSGARTFLRDLRLDPRVANTPVLLATVVHEAVANADLAEELRALDVHVLLKPFRIHALIDAAVNAWTAIQPRASRT